MQVPVKYATAVTIQFPMVKRGVVDLAVGADWTPATGDVKLCIDGAALVNTTNLPANTPSGSTNWQMALTTGETTGKLLAIQIVDSATKAVEDQRLDFYTYGHASAAIVRDLGANEQQADVAKWLGTAVATPDTAGFPKVTTTSNIKKNQALASFTFLMTDSTNHAPATGKTVTVTRSINAAAFAAGTLSAVTELANGIYSVDFGAGDLNGNVIVLRAIASGCDDCFERIVVVP